MIQEYRLEIRCPNLEDIGHGKGVLATGEIRVEVKTDGVQNKKDVINKVLDLATEFRNNYCHVVVIPQGDDEQFAT